MKAHSTTRFCFCASNLTSTLVLATVFATLRTLAIFLVWYQIRPDINQTESKFYTVFENHRKKSHSTLRAKRATLKLWTKVHLKCQKWSILASFRKLENAVKQCYQTTIRQNAENATIKKSNATY